MVKNKMQNDKNFIAILIEFLKVYNNKKLYKDITRHKNRILHLCREYIFSRIGIITIEGSLNKEYTEEELQNIYNKLDNNTIIDFILYFVCECEAREYQGSEVNSNASLVLTRRIDLGKRLLGLLPQEDKYKPLIAYSDNLLNYEFEECIQILLSESIDNNSSEKLYSRKFLRSCKFLIKNCRNYQIMIHHIDKYLEISLDNYLTLYNNYQHSIFEIKSPKENELDYIKVLLPLEYETNYECSSKEGEIPWLSYKQKSGGESFPCSFVVDLNSKSFNIDTVVDAITYQINRYAINLGTLSIEDANINLFDSKGKDNFKTSLVGILLWLDIHYRKIKSEEAVAEFIKKSQGTDFACEIATDSYKKRWKKIEKLIK